MVWPSTKWLPITRIAWRVAVANGRHAQPLGQPADDAVGVFARLDDASGDCQGQAEAETRKASDWIRDGRSRPGRACPRSDGRLVAASGTRSSASASTIAPAPPWSRANIPAATPRCRRGRPCGCGWRRSARSRGRRFRAFAPARALSAPAAAWRWSRHPRHRARGTATGGRRRARGRIGHGRLRKITAKDDLKHRAGSAVNQLAYYPLQDYTFCGKKCLWRD